MGQIKNKSMFVHEQNYVSMLKRSCSVLEDNDVEYWLEFGTLLGFARGKKFIGWDNDIDLAIDGKDFGKTKKLIPFFEGKGFICTLKRESNCYERLVLTDKEIPNFHIDLYEFQRENNIFKYRWVFPDNLPSRLSFAIFETYMKMTGTSNCDYVVEKKENPLFMFAKHVFQWINRTFGSKRTMVFYNEGTKKERYYGVDIRIPKNYEEHLRLNYGSSWRTPDSNFHNSKSGTEFIRGMDKEGFEVCRI